MAALDQTAIVAGSVLDSAVIAVSNTFDRSNEMTVTLTAAAAFDASAGGKVNVIPAPGEKTAGLPANVTYTGDFDTFAAFMEYVKTVRMMIRYIRFQTNNVANYAGRIVFGERRPNNQSPSEMPVNLSTYRENLGGNISDVIRINEDVLNGGIQIWPAMYMRFDGLVANSWVRIFLGISHWDKGATLQQLSA